jgi:alkaline phosphatase
MKRKIVSIVALSISIVVAVSAFGASLVNAESMKSIEKTASMAQNASNAGGSSQQGLDNKNAKYVFFFIGDGLSHVQMNAAQVYGGDNTNGVMTLDKLNFSQFPVNGLATTQDSTSFCPDSASTATAFSTGVKTHSGVIGLEADKTTEVANLSEIFSAKGMDIGIVSSVTINHATPAAFYAHNESRNNYFDIALQMADSGFNYFGGGTISKPVSGDQNAYDILTAKGYTIADSNEEILALKAEDDKVYAVTPVTQDSGAMPYQLDAQEGQLRLADFVEQGIEVMSDNKNGFFMMVESGKVDWACHANDAKAAIFDVYQLEDSVQVALEFMAKHPTETLIVVTGDHETGGLTIGQASTGYGTAFDLLDYQTMSYVEFDKLIKAKKAESGFDFDAAMELITEHFGLVTVADAGSAADERLVLSAYEQDKLEAGFDAFMSGYDINDEESAILYGGYNALSVSLTHILNNKAGIGWTSYSHTGTPVPVFATGAGAANFAGSYDNTDVFDKFLASVK